MSEGAPTHRLLRFINPRKLACASGLIEGVIDRNHLQRLSEAADCSDDVFARLAFSLDEVGRQVVTGTIEAKLVYQCQRCLQPMAAQAETASLKVGVVRTEEQAKQLPKSLDPWIVPGEEADVYALIEDELLLTMPLVTYHDMECIDATLLSSGDAGHTDAGAGPFGALAALRANDDDD